MSGRLLTVGPVGRDQAIRHAEHVMGTVVSFDIRPQGLDDRSARRALRRACATLHRADAVFSTWKADSPMSQFRRDDITEDEAPLEVLEVLDLCAHARRLSGGWFDPWAMAGGVDPTGLVKGWAATRALTDLRSAGVGAAMVNAGGDIAVCGQPEPTRPWRVGIRHPDDATRCLCVVTAAPQSGTAAVATSGIYERGHHVIDPHRGRPATGTVSASVVGPDLALADALATAVVAGGSDGLAAVAAVPGYSALMVGSDGTPVVTDDFPWTV